MARSRLQEQLAAKQAELSAAQQRVQQLQAERTNQAAALAELQDATNRDVAQIAGHGAGAGDADMAEAEDENDPQDAEQVDGNNMTIPEIKAWLTDHGHEGDVFEMAQRKRTRKADWVQLISSKQ